MKKEEDLSFSISNLADKLSKYHERIMTLERELEKTKKNCKCNTPPVPQFTETEIEECDTCSA